MTPRNSNQRFIRPTHPGEMLREDFMPDFGLSVKSLADSLGVSRQTINELIREKRGLSPDMALRLSRLFGNTPDFWLNAQKEVDLWDTTKKLKEVIRHIRPLKTA